MGPTIIMGSILLSWIVITFRPTFGTACALGASVFALAIVVTAWHALVSGHFDVWRALGSLLLVAFIFTWGAVAISYTATKFARGQKQNDA